MADEGWRLLGSPDDHDRPEPDATFPDVYAGPAVTGTASTLSGWTPNYPSYGD
jgi:hypothetical protein